MRPADLKQESFSKYPTQARALCVEHLSLLQQLPISFLPSLLRQIMEFDYGFPAERESVNRQLAILGRLSAAQLADWFQSFQRIQIAASKQQEDWVNQPAHFLEDLSAYLWATHQMDSFRTAAQSFGERMLAAEKLSPDDGMPRLGVAVIGQGVPQYEGKLFERLRPHGTFFRKVSPENGLRQILSVVETRAGAASAPYAHWYVDGGVQIEHSASLTSVSYAALQPVRYRLLQYIEREVAKPGMGPEQLRSGLMRLRPEDLGMQGDPVLDRFQMKLLTEGSGTQIFSTTFAQWTAREALRRAEALSLVVRYAPRQRQRPMQELLSATPADQAVDPLGSLIDADMGAYYQWIDQQRLPGSSRSIFIAWFEGHEQAIVISPSMPRGSESRSPVTLEHLISLAQA